MGLLRLGVFYAFSAVYLPIVILLALVPVSRRLWYRALRGWVRVSLAIFSVSVAVRGGENLRAGQDYVIVANHRSNLDVFALITALGEHQTRWVAKRELARVPIFGYGLRVTGQILVDRSNHQQAIESLRTKLGKHGASVVFFAEGQRAPTRELLPFKKGAAAFALDAGLPILPVAISGSDKVLHKYSLIVRPGTIEVSIGKVIDTSGVAVGARDTLTRRSREAVEALLADCEDGSDCASRSSVEVRKHRV